MKYPAYSKVDLFLPVEGLETVWKVWEEQKAGVIIWTVL